MKKILTLTLLFLLIPGVQAQCITTQQQTIIDNIAISANLSVTDRFVLLNLFESMCQQTNESVSKEYVDLKIDQATDDYNDTMEEVNETIHEFNRTLDQKLEDELRIKFNNYSTYINEKLDIVDAMNSLADLIEVDTRITQVKNDIKSDYNKEMDTVRRMIDDMQEEFITKADIENVTTQLRASVSTAQPYQRQVDYSGYWLIGFIVVAIVGAYTHSKGWLKKLNPTNNKLETKPNYGQTGDVSQVAFRKVYEDMKREMKENPEILEELEKKKKGLREKQITAMKEQIRNARDKTDGDNFE